jgi:putative transposase
MGKLKHRTAPACTYFVTTKAWQNRSLFHVSELADILVGRIITCRYQGAYLLHEFVVMPDHLHLMLTPAETTTLEKALQLIKGGSSHEIHKLRGHKIQIWQAGFHDWTIRDSADYAAKREYIWMNPVRARLAERAPDWPYGSASGRFVLDVAPDRFKLTSGAEAPVLRPAGMSELKLRPPAGDS